MVVKHICDAALRGLNKSHVNGMATVEAVNEAMLKIA
jgi:hypothetical protein